MNAFLRAVLQQAERFPSRVVTFIGLAYVLILTGLDYALPHGANFSLFYMIGIAYVAWRGGQRPAYFISVAAAILMAIDERATGVTSSIPAIAIWNALSRVVLFSAAAWLTAEVTRINRHLTGLIAERTGHYRAMMATAMDGFLIVDGSGNISEVNDAYCRILGCRREEILGAPLASVELKESPEEIQSHIARVRAQGWDRFETRHRRKDGSPVDLEISVTSLPGRGAVLISFLREISERKKAEARLRASEERYRSLSESSPDAIVVLNQQFRVDYANSAAAALWNRIPETMLGVRLDELFNAETAKLHSESVSRVFETGEPLRQDEYLSFPGGDKWIETRLVPVFAPNNKVHSIIVIAIDVSERKRTEALLQTQRDLGLKLSRTSDLDTALKALLQMAVKTEGVDSGGVFLRDLNTGALTLAAHEGALTEEFIKSVAYQPANSSRAQLVSKGQPVYELHGLIPGPAGSHDEKLRAAAILPMCHEGIVFGSLHLGSHKHLSFPLQSRFVMETVVAQTAGAIARIRSETERRRLERQILEISDREQANIGQELHDGLCQQLVSLAFDANSLQHQLRNPPFPGRSKLRSDGSEDELTESRHSDAALASRIAFYLDQAITEARHLSRGLFPIRLQAEGLPSALEELARGVSTRFGVICTAQCDEEIRVKNATAAIHLFRIAQEAVNNAIKHGRAKSIRIQLASRDGQVRLEVQDDGIGCSANYSTTKGMGLQIMDYRARSIGGIFHLTPAQPHGTSISCCI